MRAPHFIVATGAVLFGGFALAQEAALESQRYLIVAQSEGSLPADLAAQVEALGGSLDVSLEDIGVAGATSADPDFAAYAESCIPGLRSVTPSLKFTVDSLAFAAEDAISDDEADALSP